VYQFYRYKDRIILFDLYINGYYLCSRNKLKEKNMAAINITNEEFLKKVWNYKESPQEWKFKGDKPAIVDFYASWCGPCKMLAPVLDQLSEEYAGKIDIYKVDTGKEEELSRAFNIVSIPTLLFCPTAGDPQMAQGALPKSSLKEIIDNHLLK
jgi:thioredoxin